MDAAKTAILCLMIFVVNVWSEECTADQKNVWFFDIFTVSYFFFHDIYMMTFFQEMMSCSAKFFEAQGFYENDGKKGQELLIKLANSWNEFEKMCQNIYIFRKCLKPATVRNCISKKHDKSKDGYMDISPHALYITGDFMCGMTKKMMKSAYSCVTKYCSESLETDSCYEMAKSMKDCLEISKEKCEKFGTEMEEDFISFVFLARRCQNQMACHMCHKSDVLGQIMSYRPMLNFGDNTLAALKEKLQDSDTDIQLNALKEFHQLITTNKMSKKTVVENGFFSVLRQCLSSKIPEIQAEAASAFKHLIDKTPENLEAILEAEIIPALIRALISTDENVLENAIETLATIISKHPELRNIYMELNIVESLLLSYSPDISREMQHNNAQIIAHLCQNLKLEVQVIIEHLIPLLSELISSYDSNMIMDLTKNLIKAAEKDDDFKVDVEVMQTILALVEHENEDISTGASLALGSFMVNTLGEDYAEKIAHFEDLDSAEAEEAYAALPEEDKNNMLKRIKLEL